MATLMAVSWRWRARAHCEITVAVFHPTGEIGMTRRGLLFLFPGLVKERRENILSQFDQSLFSMSSARGCR